MWDPSCLVSPTCEETKSIYYHSDVPTPLLNEAMVEDNSQQQEASISSPPVESLSCAIDDSLTDALLSSSGCKKKELSPEVIILEREADEPLHHPRDSFAKEF